MGIFRLKIGKSECDIWNQNLPKCKKLYKTKKKVNLGPKMPYLGILGWKFEKLLSYLKNQHPRICHNAKFRAKLKILNLGPKMPDFPDFVVNQQSLICPKVVLTNTVNFGIGSAFMKGSQSAFSQGPLFLKVCFIKYVIWLLTPVYL